MIRMFASFVVASMIPLFLTQPALALPEVKVFAAREPRPCWRVIITPIAPKIEYKSAFEAVTSPWRFVSNQHNKNVGVGGVGIPFGGRNCDEPETCRRAFQCSAKTNSVRPDIERYVRPVDFSERPRNADIVVGAPSPVLGKPHSFVDIFSVERNVPVRNKYHDGYVDSWGMAGVGEDRFDLRLERVAFTTHINPERGQTNFWWRHGNPWPVFGSEELSGLLVSLQSGGGSVSSGGESSLHQEHGPYAETSSNDGQGRHDPLGVSVLPRVETGYRGYNARDIVLLILICVCGVFGSFHAIGWLTEPRGKNDRE